MKIILIPARGRKQRKPMKFSEYIIDYTHPREGTETLDDLYVVRQRRIILIPARGRKQNALPVSAVKDADYTHPREGTET